MSNPAAESRPVTGEAGSSPTRRSFLSLVAAGAFVGLPRAQEPNATDRSIRLEQVLAKPVLRTDFVRDPLRISSMELLLKDRSFLVRTRTTDGLEVITVPHQAKLAETWPIFLKRVAPFFKGKDARDLESLLRGVYRFRSNYKLQGIALWPAVAAAEMALLELMGQAAGRPLADFFGGSRQRDIAVYYASGNRGNTPAAEIEHLRKLVAGSGVQAIKWRAGGRMSRNADSRPRRTEALIPRVREAFGPDMTIYADSNSSYDAAEAIRIGRIMEEHEYGFFEEPCEFDDLWSTRRVADALSIPVAGGEQEYSLHRWKWAIAHRAVDIVQPDLHYGGGFVRATQVARMAAAMQMPVVPHMSGGGLGYVDVVQFASFTPNIGPFMEFKGNTNLPVTCPSSSLRCEQGRVRCPLGPGLGVNIDPAFVKASRVVKRAEP